MTRNVGKTEVIARDELHLVGVWRGVPVVMFEGYRNGVFALGLIIGVGMATASILWVFGLNYCPNQPCRYSGAADDPSGDHGRVWQFPSAMRGTFSFPLEPDLAEGGPKRYEYYDLRAQERMAHATDWIAWLTLISSVISVFGLGALLYSLAQTKRAISDTREIGEAQVRAYLSFNVNAIGYEALNAPAGEDQRVKITFQGKLVNSGQSPAIRASVKFFLELVRPDDHSHTFTGDEMVDTGQVASFIPANGDTNQEVSRIVTVDPNILASGDRVPFFILAIEYTDVFGVRPDPFFVSGHVINLMGPVEKRRIIWANFTPPDD